MSFTKSVYHNISVTSVILPKYVKKMQTIVLFNVWDKKKKRVQHFNHNYILNTH